MQKILVIGASGFVGKHLVGALLADGYAARGLARNPARVQDLAAKGCEIVQGDISDLASVGRAVECVQAVYISVHTLSPQHTSTAGQGFMEVEMNGLRNIVAACRTHGVRRLIYITFLGATPDSRSEWVRERWKAEQFLLNSGLDVTVIRPGQIVGLGGHGFDLMVSQSKRRISVNLFGSGRQRMRNISVSDLVYYLVGVLSDRRAYGQCYDVGSDEVLTNNEMIDVAAEALGRRPPAKVDLPPAILGLFAPLIERLSKFPKGAIRGILDSVDTDCVGDPAPIRAILPRPPLPYRQAVKRALTSAGRLQR